MTEFFTWMQSHETLLWWLGIGSAVTFVGSLLAVPFLVSWIPADYFADRERHGRRFQQFPWMLRWPLLIIKNLFGVIFVVVGIILIPLPGQGLLMVLVGIVLLDFPRKFDFERWIVTRGPIHKAVDFVRDKMGREPLVIDGHDAEVDETSSGDITSSDP